MALTPDQVKELKGQLRKQVEDLPVTQKEAALKQIDEMSDEAIEEMVKQQQAQQSGGDQKGVFRMIVDGDIPSRKIGENEDAIAVVSVRPVSKGHILVIPKKAAEKEADIPQKAHEIAKDIAEGMPQKLKCKTAEVQQQAMFGETILNVIPIYDKPITTTSPSYEATQEEISEIGELLKILPKITKKPKPVTIKKEKEKPKDPIKLKRRIP